MTDFAIPRVTEVKWMSLWNALDYVLCDSRRGYFIHEYGTAVVERVQALRNWMAPIQMATLELEREKANMMTLARELVKLARMTESAPRLVVFDRSAFQKLLSDRFRTNFYSDALLMTIALNPTTILAELDPSTRDHVVKQICSKGAALCHTKFPSLTFEFISCQLQNDLGKLLTGQLVTQHSHDYIEHWTLVVCKAPYLGTLALQLVDLSISEASVERAFAVIGRTFTSARNRMANETLEDIIFQCGRVWEHQPEAFRNEPSLAPNDVKVLLDLVTNRQRIDSVLNSGKLKKGDRIAVAFLEGTKTVYHVGKLHNRTTDDHGKQVWAITWESSGGVGVFDAEVDFTWVQIHDTPKEKNGTTDVAAVCRKRAREKDES